LDEDALGLTKAYKLFLIKASNDLTKYETWCGRTAYVPREV